MGKLSYWLGDKLLDIASFISTVGWRLLGWNAADFSDDYSDGDFDDDDCTGVDFCVDESDGTCLTCGARVQLVRPGKWQCPNQGVDGHD